jgi:two-component system response regulator FixJ
MLSSVVMISRSEPSGVAPQVLVAQVDPALRKAFEFLFRAEGFRVSACADPDDLLRMDLPASGMCLVVDHGSSRKRGLGVLQELRGRGMTLPAILVVDRPTPRLRAAAADIGVAVLEKPLLGDALATAVRSALAA